MSQINECNDNGDGRPWCRRRFLRDGARLLLAAGIAGAGVVLATDSDGECRYAYACRGCRLLPDCRLPAARQTRDAMAGEDSDG